MSHLETYECAETIKVHVNIIVSLCYKCYAIYLDEMVGIGSAVLQRKQKFSKGDAQPPRISMLRNNTTV